MNTVSYEEFVDTFPAFGNASGDLVRDILSIDFGKIMHTSEEMRHFVFEIMSRRLAAVMTLVEEVAFGRMDMRLKEYLLEKAEHGVLISTHQKIADDLGTSREVVSRLLKDLACPHK